MVCPFTQIRSAPGLKKTIVWFARGRRAVARPALHMPLRHTCCCCCCCCCCCYYYYYYWYEKLRLAEAGAHTQ